MSTLIATSIHDSFLKQNKQKKSFTLTSAKLDLTGQKDAKRRTNSKTQQNNKKSTATFTKQNFFFFLIDFCRAESKDTDLDKYPALLQFHKNFYRQVDKYSHSF